MFIGANRILLGLEAVETERRNRLCYIYSDYTPITLHGVINAYYENRNYEKHQKTRFLVSRIGFEPITPSLKKGSVRSVTILVSPTF